VFCKGLWPVPKSPITVHWISYNGFGFPANHSILLFSTLLNIKKFEKSEP